jgi:hypothetical protein
VGDDVKGLSTVRRERYTPLKLRGDVYEAEISVCEKPQLLPVVSQWLERIQHFQLCLCELQSCLAYPGSADDHVRNHTENYVFITY